MVSSHLALNKLIKYYFIFWRNELDSLAPDCGVVKLTWSRCCGLSVS